MARGEIFLWGCIDRGICRGKMLFTFGHRSMHLRRKALSTCCIVYTIRQRNCKYFYSKQEERKKRNGKNGVFNDFFFLFFFNAKGEMERLVKIVNCERNCWTFFSRNDRGFSWFENYLNFFLNVNHLFNPFKPNPRVVVCVVLFFELEFSSVG